MFCTILSGAFCGIDSALVQVEVDVAPGLPCMELIGASGREALEARQRIRVALKNIGVKLPAARITINLSPADRHKSGTAFDLPAAAGLLVSLGILEEKKLEGILFAGELGLSGEIKPVKGILPIVRMAEKQHLKACIVPAGNSREAAEISGIPIYVAEHLTQIREAFSSSFEQACIRTAEEMLLEMDKRERGMTSEKETGQVHGTKTERMGTKMHLRSGDFADIAGQETAKRAAEIAAAGFHHMLLIGPPGSGKTMLASRMGTILPPLTKEERLDVLTIYSAAGKMPLLPEGKRVFLAPHHTATGCALVGGGRVPMPGAVSLAHRGVLFLDELPEFKRSVLDMLRQPLEEKSVQIARNYGTVCYPAEFMLIGAMNPCPCGYYPDEKRCRCTDAQIRNYLSHISGPLLDRIDLCVEMQKMERETLLSDQDGREKRENSAAIRKRVMRAREIQKRRFAKTGICFNAEMGVRELETYCLLDEKSRKWLKDAADIFGLSLRACHRMIRVARTIADLDEKEFIEEGHLKEAVYYRTGAEDYWKRKGMP